MRQSTYIEAVLVREDGTEEAVVITNISEGGFRLEVTGTPGIGERVVLRAEGNGDLPAQIRWALGSQAGGAFIEAKSVRKGALRPGLGPTP